MIKSGTDEIDPDAALFARAKAILDKAPLIDSHNDLPSMLLERYGGNIAELDLSVAHPELCADVPRLRGGVSVRSTGRCLRNPRT